MHSASCIATFFVQDLRSSYNMTRCRICKNPKFKVIKDKRICEGCEELMSFRREVYEANYEVIRIENAKFFDVLKSTHESVTEEELKSYYIDFHLNIYEQELKRELRKPKRKTFCVGKKVYTCK